MRGSRNWRRIKHLSTRLHNNSLNPKELWRYKFHNLFKMQELIQNVNHKELNIPEEHAKQLQMHIKGVLERNINKDIQKYEGQLVINLIKRWKDMTL